MDGQLSEAFTYRRMYIYSLTRLYIDPTGQDRLTIASKPRKEHFN